MTIALATLIGLWIGVSISNLKMTERLNQFTTRQQMDRDFRITWQWLPWFNQLLWYTVSGAIIGVLITLFT